MNHGYNKKCFLDPTSSKGRLPALYGILTAIELAIKDYEAENGVGWPGGHGIIGWLSSIDTDTTQSIALRDALACLYCTDKNGNESNINPDIYPGLRYLRHEDDFPGKSTEHQLDSAYETAEQVVRLLRTKGYSI